MKALVHRWTKNGQSLTFGPSYYINYLIKADHQGPLECTVETEVDSMTTSYQLNVITQPPKLEQSGPLWVNISIWRGFANSRSILPLPIIGVVSGIKTKGRELVRFATSYVQSGLLQKFLHKMFPFRLEYTRMISICNRT